MPPRNSDTNSSVIIATLILFGTLTLLLVAFFSLKPTDVGVLSPTAIAIKTTQENTVQPVSLSVSAIDPVKVTAGETIFQTVCSACHGFNAKGIPGLGKPLIGSEFVNSQSDGALLAFLNTGRPVDDPLNTTGVMMPPKGGNPGLTDNDLQNVIEYIRSLELPAGSIAQLPTTIPTASGPTPTPIVFVPLPLSAPSDVVENTSTVSTAIPTQQSTNMFGTNGEAAYVQNCAGCHGSDGRGLPYLGSSLADSELLKQHDGIAILNLLTASQPPMNPETGFQHPYRGGYPELHDEQLRDVIAYMYTLLEAKLNN